MTGQEQVYTDTGFAACEKPARYIQQPGRRRGRKLTASYDENGQMRGVAGRNIDRFAFREAPLTYLWQEPEGA